MNLQNILVSVVTAAVVVLLGFGLFGGDKPTLTQADLQNAVDKAVQNLGAAAGPEHTERQYFQGSLTNGKGCFSTTTTGTLQYGDLIQNHCIYISPAGAGQAVLALTLPASTTMSRFIPDAGSCASWWIDASDVAAATTTTITAGTGWNVVGLDATGAGTGADVIDGAEYGKLTACRETDGDITGFVEEWIHAD